MDEIFAPFCATVTRPERWRCQSPHSQCHSTSHWHVTPGWEDTSTEHENIPQKTMILHKWGRIASGIVVCAPLHLAAFKAMYSWGCELLDRCLLLNGLHKSPSGLHRASVRVASARCSVMNQHAAGSRLHAMAAAADFDGLSLARPLRDLLHE
jgi:hypothetical protein